MALALFIDISKAFNSLDHTILISKLEHYCVRGVALLWFSSYLTSRFHFTEINNNRSLCKVMKTSIPQESILGLLQYTIYVNDIFHISNNVKCVLYADDTVLVVFGKILDVILKAATELFALYSIWFSDNGLAINASKSNYLVFCVKNDFTFTLFPDVLQFDLHSLTKVDVDKYLGIYIDRWLNFKQHCITVNDKLTKGIAIIKKCRDMVPKECLFSLYYSYILPYLIYCIELWGLTCDKYLHPIYINQKKAIELIAGVNRLTHCESIALNLNILLLPDLYRCIVLSLMCRVYNNSMLILFNICMLKLVCT